MRKGESEQVIDVFKNQMDANLVYADATDRFLGKLVDVAEPVKLLYKDEVHVVGRELGLPENMVERQPFPGPGLGVRCLGAIARDRLEALREADAIVREEIDKAGLTIWQYFAVVPDFRATGVRDGKRAYDWPCIIRCINTVDVMTADGARARLGAAQAHYCPHYRRDPRHLPRLLRPHAQARRHSGMGVIPHIIVRLFQCESWCVLERFDALIYPKATSKQAAEKAFGYSSEGLFVLTSTCD